MICSINKSINFVSIPKVVRLKEFRIIYFILFIDVSIPKVVRLKEQKEFGKKEVKSRFNSKSGSIKRKDVFDNPEEVLKFQFQKWFD